MLVGIDDGEHEIFPEIERFCLNAKFKYVAILDMSSSHLSRVGETISEECDVRNKL